MFILMQFSSQDAKKEDRAAILKLALIAKDALEKLVPCFIS